MNEMFIFFKIPVALKKIIESKDVFNKREVNVYFLPDIFPGRSRHLFQQIFICLKHL